MPNNIDETYRVNNMTRDLSSAAALKRLKLILDTPAHLTDDKGFVLSTNRELEAAQDFIRNNLDLKGAGLDDLDPDEGLTEALAAMILDDLRLIWGHQYYRDELSEIAMALSLCPMHFIDWAACFDDDEPECAAIRTCFPFSHDT